MALWVVPGAAWTILLLVAGVLVLCVGLTGVVAPALRRERASMTWFAVCAAGTALTGMGLVGLIRWAAS